MKKKFVYTLLCLSVILGACKHETHEVHDEHAHEHEDVKILLTAYNDKFELFAEADPFVVNENSRVLVHLTHLDNFKPLLEGRVTFKLVLANKVTEQTIENPNRPGIYIFKIKPEAAGKAKILVEIKGKEIVSTIEINDAKIFSDEHEAIHEAEERVVASSTAIMFTKEQSWKVDFATQNPAIMPFGQVIKTTGQIQSAQSDETILTAKTSGIISLNELLIGEKVSANEQLFTILGNGLAENNLSVKFAEAANNFEKAKADYERAKALANEKIISEKDLLLAKVEFENAEAIYSNLKKNFSANGQQVNSPTNGYIGQVYVKNGQFVESGEALVTISQNKNLLIFAEVQQKYAKILKLISSVSIKTLFDGKVYKLNELNGKVVSFGKNVNSDNFLLPVIFQIDNSQDFIPGSFVELYITSQSNSSALTIPSSALLEEQGNFFVMVQITPELFEKREVKVGATDGVKVEIISGIEKSDRIVTKGAMLVKLAQSSAALDPHSGHVH